MRESFDAYEYIDAMRRRWRVVALACIVAGALTLLVSMLLPKRYTATASIMIEPPGGNDARMATAVSPIYLESLKTYERLAASDTLFARAAEKFQLRGGSLESLKRRILKVNKLRDTRILELSATLPDPKVAQQLVQFLAEETVIASRNQSLASDSDVLEQTRTQKAEAQSRLEAARKARAQSAGETVETLRTEIDTSTDVLAQMRQQLVGAEADIAEYESRLKSGASSAADLNAAKARASLLERKVAELQQSIEQKNEVLARRSVRRDEARMEIDNAQTAYETAANRLRDVQAVAGTRGERLRVIDPGIVPQRPSSPNAFLNVIAAVMIAFIGSVVVLSLRFAMQGAKAVRRREPASRGIAMR